jgi:hypothetical protein
MVRRSRSIRLPEPASLTNSLKICEQCRLAGLVLNFGECERGDVKAGRLFRA